MVNKDLQCFEAHRLMEDDGNGEHLYQTLRRAARHFAQPRLGARRETTSSGTKPEDRDGNDCSQDMPPQRVECLNKRFAKLDDYLAWLRETQAPIDRPWYEEVAPGSYLLRTGNLRIVPMDGAESPTERPVSRAQLMKQFGFTR